MWVVGWLKTNLNRGYGAKMGRIIRIRVRNSRMNASIIQEKSGMELRLRCAKAKSFILYGEINYVSSSGSTHTCGAMPSEYGPRNR